VNGLAVRFVPHKALQHPMWYPALYGPETDQVKMFLILQAIFLY
jgi:hypothetical protein